MKPSMLKSARRWKKGSVVQRWSRYLIVVLPPRDKNWCFNLICGSLNAPTPTAVRWKRRIHEQSYASMVVEQRQWRRQWEGCAYEALAMREVHNDEALALQRQWWRQSERCTDDALALRKGCNDEALALMIAGRRQWQRESERRTYGYGTRAQKKGGTKLWTQRQLEKVDQWRNRRGSGANSCEVETTDMQTKLCTYGCEMRAVSVICWILRRRVEQSSGLSADSRRLINDESANAWVRCTPRGEEYDAAICFEP